jgi:hypothetical protein
LTHALKGWQKPVDSATSRMYRKKYQLYEIDHGFKYRNLFMLAVTSFFLMKLLFFPESVMSNFSSSFTPSMAKHLRFRGLYLLLVMMIYIYSYYKDWYFETVAFIVFELAVFNVVGDFANVYSKFSHGSVPSTLIFFSLLRFSATVCLFLNTFNSHRAPLPPRRFWSS